MPLTLKLKRSSIVGVSPSTSQLVDGEIAVNTFDGRLFLRKNDGVPSVIDVANSATTFSGVLSASGGTIDNIKIGRGNGAITGNIAIGNSALANNVSGINNVAIGNTALNKSVSNHNIAIGQNSQLNTTSGGDNISIGVSSLSTNSSGVGNIAIGSSSLNIATGSGNIAIGDTAGQTIGSGSNNIVIGNSAQIGSASNINCITIGSGSIGLGTNTTQIGNSSTNLTKIWGAISLDSTITTTNSATFTINKAAGILTCTAASVFVVTNSLVNANTIVVTQYLSNNNTNRYVRSVVAGAGTFTITLSGAAAAGAKIGFFLIQTT